MGAGVLSARGEGEGERGGARGDRENIPTEREWRDNPPCLQRSGGQLWVNTWKKAHAIESLLSEDLLIPLSLVGRRESLGKKLIRNKDKDKERYLMQNLILILIISLFSEGEKERVGELKSRESKKQ